MNWSCNPLIGIKRQNSLFVESSSEWVAMQLFPSRCPYETEKMWSCGIFPVKSFVVSHCYRLRQLGMREARNNNNEWLWLVVTVSAQHETQYVYCNNENVTLQLQLLFITSSILLVRNSYSIMYKVNVVSYQVMRKCVTFVTDLWREAGWPLLFIEDFFTENIFIFIRLFHDICLADMKLLI